MSATRFISENMHIVISIHNYISTLSSGVYIVSEKVSSIGIYIPLAPINKKYTYVL